MFNLFNNEKSYFKRKQEAVQKMIWDMEFKRFIVLRDREQIRQEYDGLKSKLHILDSQITSQKENPTMEKGDIARLDDQKVLLERDIQRTEESLAGKDAEVNGLPKSADYPDGVTGINDQLEALHVLYATIPQYLKIL